jgi:hypothetical protein
MIQYDVILIALSWPIIPSTNLMWNNDKKELKQEREKL